MQVFKTDKRQKVYTYKTRHFHPSHTIKGALNTHILIAPSGGSLSMSDPERDPLTQKGTLVNPAADPKNIKMLPMAFQVTNLFLVHRKHTDTFSYLLDP